jgi:hypothetical protein
VNWLASRVTLRVRNLSEILDLGLVFSAENREAYARLAAAILVVPFAICVTLQFLDVPWWQIWGIAILLGAIAEGAFTAAAGQLLFAESVRTRTLVAPFGRRFVPYLAARLASALAVIACAPLVIPLPGMVARALFVPEYCLLEAASPIQCLRRGGRLMKTQTAQAAVLALLLVVARVAFITVGDALGQSLVEFVFQLGRPLGSLFHEGGSTYALASFFLSIPYVSSARFLGYVDSRTRREGWDIQVRFAALAQRAASEEAAA